MIRRLKNSAGPTSIAASTTTSARGLPGGARSRCLWAFSIMTMAAVDHGADRNGDATEAHDVGAEPEEVHAEIGDQHPERQRDDRHQRAADMEKKDEADQRDDGALLDQRAFERVDRAVDQV